MKLLVVFLVLVVSNTAQAQNLVFCWLFNHQGCPDAEPRQGRAITLENNGSGGLLGPSHRTVRPERRNIITIEDYQIRRIQRFFGLGGNRINISYEGGNKGCLEGADPMGELSGLDHTLLRTDFKTCFQALEREVSEYPGGINLDLIQCQDFFCEESFLERFREVLNSQNQVNIPNVEQFLRCQDASIEA